MFAIEVFQKERSLFLRESSAGFYGVGHYMLSKFVYEVFWIGFGCVLNLCGAYWLAGLRGNFAILAFDSLIISMGSSSLMFILSALSKNREMATNLSIMPMVLQFVFSGVIIPQSMIPESLRWVRWLC